jgi:hypothetical protein
MRGAANRGRSAEIRLGAPVRFSIHAGGDGRRTAGEYAGLVGVVRSPAVLPRAPCGFSARRGVAGRTTRPSASTLGETVPPPMPGGYGFSQ